MLRFVRWIAVVGVAFTVTLLWEPPITAGPGLARPRPASPAVTSEQAGDPVVARKALRERNDALNAAIKRNTVAALTEAISQALKAIEEIDTLGLATVLRKEALVTVNLTFKAQGALFKLLRDNCQKRTRLEHGLLAARLLRRLSGTQRQGIGLELIKGIERDLATCLRLELLVDSRIVNKTLEYEVHVDVRIPLGFDLATGVYSGTGEIALVTQKIKFADACTMKIGSTPATFTVAKLEITLADNGSDVRIGDVKLSDYSPMPRTETAMVTCPKSGSRPTTFPNWGLSYLTVHWFNKNVEVVDWTLGQPADALASKAFRQETTKSLLVESTDFFLRRP